MKFTVIWWKREPCIEIMLFTTSVVSPSYFDTYCLITRPFLMTLMTLLTSTCRYLRFFITIPAVPLHTPRRSHYPSSPFFGHVMLVAASVVQEGRHGRERQTASYVISKGVNIWRWWGSVPWSVRQRSVVIMTSHRKNHHPSPLPALEYSRITTTKYVHWCRFTYLLVCKHRIRKKTARTPGVLCVCARVRVCVYMSVRARDWAGTHDFWFEFGLGRSHNRCRMAWVTGGVTHRISTRHKHKLRYRT